VLEEGFGGDAQRSAVAPARPVEARRILEQLEDPQSRRIRQYPKSFHQLHETPPDAVNSAHTMEDPEGNDNGGADR
jgi:hypothetical protein